MINTAKFVYHITAKSSEDRLIQLPLARVRNIMKIDPDVPLLSQEGVFAITKATVYKFLVAKKFNLKLQISFILGNVC